jgi:hypothetical protein
MPPMKAAPIQPASDGRTLSSPSQHRLAPGGTRRLRQIVAAITGGGFAVVLAVIALELIARPGIRPTDLMAMIEARTELGIMNQKLDVPPGEVRFTEAEYQEIITKAQREGQAQAELAFQQDMALIEADKTRLIGAYQTLFERTNIIAQGAIQMEGVAQQLRNQLLAASNGGRSMVIGVKDIFCGLGDPAACASARADRQMMIGEADELSRGELGLRVRELMAGIDDPATLIAETDRRRNGTPLLAREP